MGRERKRPRGKIKGMPNLGEFVFNQRIKKILKIRESHNPKHGGIWHPELGRKIGWSIYLFNYEFDPIQKTWDLDTDLAKWLIRSCTNCGDVFLTKNSNKKHCCKKCDREDFERWRKIKRCEELSRQNKRVITP